MMRVSPPELAREFPGPHESTSVTRAPRRCRYSAVQPPNAPAPTTKIRVFLAGVPTVRPDSDEMAFIGENAPRVSDAPSTAQALRTDLRGRSFLLRPCFPEGV